MIEEGVHFPLLPRGQSSVVADTGLDPAIGLFHAEDETRPSLALDLMEEFRPLIVDQVVVTAIRRGDLGSGNAEPGPDGGVYLDRPGRSVLMSSYERRMVQLTRGALPGFTGSWRRHLYRQAERLAGFVENPEGTWDGLSWR